MSTKVGLLNRKLIWSVKPGSIFIINISKFLSYLFSKRNEIIKTHNPISWTFILVNTNEISDNIRLSTLWENPYSPFWRLFARKYSHYRFLVGHIVHPMIAEYVSCSLAICVLHFQTTVLAFNRTAVYWIEFKTRLVYNSGNSLKTLQMKRKSITFGVKCLNCFYVHLCQVHFHWNCSILECSTWGKDEPTNRKLQPAFLYKQF